MPSRRRVLTSAGAVGAATLAGCLGIGAESAPDAQAWSVTPGDILHEFAVNDTGLYAAFGEEDDTSDEAGGVVRVDTESGDEEWRAALDTDPDELYVDGERSYVVIHYNDDPQTETEYDGFSNVVALDGAGEQRWRRRVPVTHGPLVGDDERLYVIANEELHAIDHEGTTLWRTESTLRDREVAVHDGTVYVCGRRVDTFDGGVVALDAATGEERWRRDDAFQSTPATPPAVTDDRMYVPGRWSLVALDTGSGETVWEHYFGAEWVEALSVTDDTVSVATATTNGRQDGGGRFGTLYGLYTENAAEQSEFTFDVPVVDAAFEGRRAFVVIEGGRVVVTRTDTRPTAASYEVDLGWDEDREGTIEALGTEAYVGTPDNEILKLVPSLTDE